MRVDIEDIFKAQEVRSKINKPLTSELQFYKDGVEVDISKEELDEWDFIGLNNINFIIMREW